MKKLQGVPTICAVLAMGIAVMVYKFSHFDGPHSFTYILPFDLAIYRMAGEDLNAGGLLYDAHLHHSGRHHQGNGLGVFQRGRKG